MGGKKGGKGGPGLLDVTFIDGFSQWKGKGRGHLAALGDKGPYT
jgi:hypothetical protein